MVGRLLHQALEHKQCKQTIYLFTFYIILKLNSFKLHSAPNIPLGKQLMSISEMFC